MPTKGECIKVENVERKMKTPFMIYADFESALVPEDNGKQNQMSLILANNNNMLIVVMVVNQYVLMINLVSF